MFSLWTAIMEQLWHGDRLTVWDMATCHLSNFDMLYHERHVANQNAGKLGTSTALTFNFHVIDHSWHNSPGDMSFYELYRYPLLPKRAKHSWFLKRTVVYHVRVTYMRCPTGCQSTKDSLKKVSLSQFLCKVAHNMSTCDCQALVPIECLVHSM